MVALLMLIIGGVIMWMVIEGKAYAFWNAIAYGQLPSKDAGTK